MLKLITPPGLLLTTALLAIYAFAAARVAYVEHSFALAAAAAVSAVACCGVALMRRWSQYLVYLLTVAFASKWCWSIYDAYRAGYFDFRFGGETWRAMRPLAPGLAMIALSGTCSWIVRRQFKPTQLHHSFRSDF